MLGCGFAQRARPVRGKGPSPPICSCDFDSIFFLPGMRTRAMGKEILHARPCVETSGATLARTTSEASQGVVTAISRRGGNSAEPVGLRAAGPHRVTCRCAVHAGARIWIRCWASLKRQVDAPRPEPRYKIDSKDNSIAPSPPLSAREWDEIFEVMRDNGITGLRAAGQMTDATLERLAQLDLATSLDLAGSRRVTDAGLQHVARMPRVERLNLSGCDITDHGLAGSSGASRTTGTARVLPLSPSRHLRRGAGTSGVLRTARASASRGLSFRRRDDSGAYR
jgi:hypothetical protein